MNESDRLRLELIAERPIVRDDEPSDVDIALELQTMTAIGESSTPSYAINLCVVIDRSGSMSNNDKLEHAKRSCVEILDSLSDQDHFTVLAFDTRFSPLLIRKLHAMRSARGFSTFRPAEAPIFRRDGTSVYSSCKRTPVISTSTG